MADTSLIIYGHQIGIRGLIAGRHGFSLFQPPGQLFDLETRVVYFSVSPLVPWLPTGKNICFFLFYIFLIFTYAALSLSPAGFVSSFSASQRVGWVIYEPTPRRSHHRFNLFWGRDYFSRSKNQREDGRRQRGNMDLF